MMEIEKEEEINTYEKIIINSSQQKTFFDSNTSDISKSKDIKKLLLTNGEPFQRKKFQEKADSNFPLDSIGKTLIQKNSEIFPLNEGNLNLNQIKLKSLPQYSNFHWKMYNQYYNQILKEELQLSQRFSLLQIQLEDKENILGNFKGLFSLNDISSFYEKDGFKFSDYLFFKQKFKKENLKENNSKGNSQKESKESDTEIGEKRRAIVIDWLEGLSQYLNTSDECLFLSINIFDKYLISNYQSLVKEDLQLLGVCSYGLATKYMEMGYFSFEELNEFTDNSYSIEKIKNMEERLLKSINYNLIQGNFICFYDLLCLYFDFDLDEYYFGKYLLEISMLYMDVYSFSKIILSLTAVYLTMKYNVQKHPNYKECYSVTLSKSDSAERKIKKCAIFMKKAYEEMKNNSKFKGSSEKYNNRIIQIIKEKNINSMENYGSSNSKISTDIGSDKENGNEENIQ